MLVYWEMTQACGLACKHCRAQAMPKAHPLELNTEESNWFLQLIGFGDPLPHLILTGGDPLSRKDIYPLIDYANGLGLEVSITPSAIPELTNAQGILQLAVSRQVTFGISVARRASDFRPQLFKRRAGLTFLCAVGSTC
jgi:MoaA/NifB/PqqE/SkfB family radical SAM enzyme